MSYSDALRRLSALDNSDHPVEVGFDVNDPSLIASPDNPLTRNVEFLRDDDGAALLDREEQEFEEEHALQIPLQIQEDPNAALREAQDFFSPGRSYLGSASPLASGFVSESGNVITSPGEYFGSRSVMPESTPVRYSGRAILPAQTPLGYTPNRTELDAATRERLREKFENPGYRVPSLSASDAYGFSSSYAGAHSQQPAFATHERENRTDPAADPAFDNDFGDLKSVIESVKQDRMLQADEERALRDAEEQARLMREAELLEKELNAQAEEEHQRQLSVQAQIQEDIRRKKQEDIEKHKKIVENMIQEELRRRELKSLQSRVQDDDHHHDASSGRHGGDDDGPESESDSENSMASSSIHMESARVETVRELRKLAEDWKRENDEAQAEYEARLNEEEEELNSLQSHVDATASVSRQEVSIQARRVSDIRMISCSENSLEFGYLLVGRESTNTVRLVNEGHVPVIVSGKISMSSEPWFEILGDASRGKLLLPPQSYAVVQVRFHPPADSLHAEKNSLSVTGHIQFVPVDATGQIQGIPVDVFLVGFAVPRVLQTDLWASSLQVNGDLDTASFRVFNTGSEPRDLDLHTESQRHVFQVFPNHVRLPGNESFKVAVSVREGSTHTDVETALAIVDKKFGEALRFPLRFSVLSRGKGPSKLSARSDSAQSRGPATDSDRSDMMFPEHASESLSRSDSAVSRKAFLSAPDSVVWSELVVGTSGSSFVSLVNSGPRPLKCTLRLDHQPTEGFLHGSFACPPEVLVPETSTVEVEVTYSALSAGEERASLRVLSEDAYLTVRLLAKSVVPSWEMIPSDVLNFGGIEDTHESSLQQLSFFNPLPCEIKLHVRLEKRPKFEADVAAFQILEQNVVVPAGGKANVAVKFCPQDYDRSQGRRVYEADIVSRYVPTFGISRMSPQNEEMTKRIATVGVYGYTRLQVPKTCQMLHFAGGIDESVSRTLPIRNAGSLTAFVELSISPEGAFTVDQRSFSLAPNETKKIAVVFRAKEPGRSDAFLSLSCPGSQYRIPLAGHAEEVPLLVCDRPIVNFGGIPVDGFAESHLVVRNNGSDKCYLRVHLFDKDVEAIDALKKLERAAGFADDSAASGIPESARASESVFTLVKPRSTVIIDGKSEISLLLRFASRNVDQYRGCLILESAWGSQYKVPLIAYSGTSEVLMDHRAPSGVMQLSVIPEDAVQKRSFGLRNDGDRSAFVHVASIEAGTRFSCSPTSFVIPAKSSCDLTLEFKPLSGDSEEPRFRDFMYSVVLVWGDELVRQRRRLSKIQRLRLGDKPVFDEFDDTFLGSNAAEMPLIFEGEEYRFDDFFDEEVFMNSRKTYRFALVGSILPKQAYANLLSSQPFSKTPGVAPPAEAAVKAGAVSVGHAIGLSAASWMIAPAEIRLFRIFDAATVLLANPTSRPVDFSVETVPTVLEVKPSRGIVAPYSDVRLVVKAVGFSDKPQYVRVAAQDRAERICVVLGNSAKDPSPKSSPAKQSVSKQQTVAASIPERESAQQQETAKDVDRGLILNDVVAVNDNVVLSDLPLGSEQQIDLQLLNRSNTRESVFQIAHLQSPTNSDALFQIPAAYRDGRIRPGMSVYVPVHVFALIPGSHILKFKVNEAQTVSIFFSVVEPLGHDSSVLLGRPAVPETPLPLHANPAVHGVPRSDVPPTPTPVKQWLSTEGGSNAVVSAERDWRIEMKGSGSTAAMMSKNSSSNVLSSTARKSSLNGASQSHSTSSSNARASAAAASASASGDAFAAVEACSSKNRKGLYLREDVVVFPMTEVGVARMRKVSVCNGAMEPMKVIVQIPAPPFHVKHREFVVRPRSYVLLPIKFIPEKEGNVFRSMSVMTSDATATCSLTLYGDGWNSPLHLQDKPVYFFPSKSSTETVLLTNVSDHPVEWHASVDDARFSVCESGVLQPDSTYDLVVGVDLPRPETPTTESSSSLSLSRSETTEQRNAARTFSGTLRIKAGAHRHTLKLHVVTE
eukprot:ANDGO_04757.mRNA.1 hypothetical protein